ncbi:thioredoxin domain-containing protein 16 isoform X2 [Latimeria chalumnae]|uniref:thioredoxin domain-containing protein 16 isoform X2 n=1 Tax=Latimeria chalumnae TaxID=7897 RepID=UPI0003C1A221|nr:PREDICTED: thioredoxin domain-containing protein 16 isoform X2 [Latimeria chalumnae]|eukprot:XP_005986550.1 PREDICTED: thioredoxin domain-containing protein 16 isoform X2 [Latimeria chalumnae]
MVAWSFSSLFVVSFLCRMVLAQKKIPEINQQEFISIMQSGKTSLIYFSQTSPPDVKLFLEQLEKSIDSLEDYGISVAKVNCVMEKIPKYCANENVLREAHLFRGDVRLRGFPIDTLFDVNAIVANVLFVLLFNEVKYVSSISDFQNIENALKGRIDAIFAYVQALGTPEHRAVMETAFVYGSKYQFILTTESSVLKSLGKEDLNRLSSSLWFCQCKPVTTRTQPCQKSMIGLPLTTINIHRYLKLVEAPLVVEVAGKPEEITTVHSQLKLPLVYILTQRGTYKLDKAIAEHIAWRLLGNAGVILLSRDHSKVNIPPKVNVGFRTAKQGAPIQYLSLQDIEEIVDLVQNKLDEKQSRELTETLEEEEVDNLDVQDDQVAEAVYRDRKKKLHLDSVQTLTEKTFNTALIGTAHTVVLFYLNWEAVSLAFMQSYVEASLQLKEIPDVLLSRINCGEWTNLCMQQNVNQFPTIKVYIEGEKPLLYTGILGTEELVKFIMLIPVPLKLASMEETEDFLHGELYKSYTTSYSKVSVLGIFCSNMREEMEAFVEAGKLLRGYVVTGVYIAKDLQLAGKYAVSLPALILSRVQDKRIDPVLLSNHNIEHIVQRIQQTMLEAFPEITVENLPIYMKLQNPLLMLFLSNDSNSRDKEELADLVKGKNLSNYTAGWLSLKNTPIGKKILKRYLNCVPPLPVLVLVQIDSGQIYRFPSGQHVTSVTVQKWLRKVEAGEVKPSTMLSDEGWNPPLPAYNFLDMMDEVSSGFATQRVPNVLRSKVLQKEKTEVHKHEREIGDEKNEPLKKTEKSQVTKSGTSRGFTDGGKQHKNHSEL